MISVKFLIRNPKEGINSVVCRVKNGRKFDLTAVTKETSNLQDWNQTEGKLLESFTEVRNGRSVTKNDAVTKSRILENRNVNDRLEALRRTVEDAYKESNGNIDGQWLKELIFPSVVQEIQAYDIVDYCNVFLVAKGNTIKHRYKQKIEAIEAILKRYKIHKKIKRLTLPEIDGAFRNDFENYCRTIEIHCANYFEGNMKFIKTMLYHAKADGHEINEGIRYIKGKVEKIKFQYLTFKEIDQIEQTDFVQEHLMNAKDWLIISCMIGQRVSDFMRFHTSMLRKELIDGKEKWFIEFTQVKTDKTLVLPLHEKIIRILEKRDWSFPVTMSEQKYNLHIKQVCKQAGIDELVEGSLFPKKEQDSKKSTTKTRKIPGLYPKYQLITSHSGRRSFATNFYGLIPTPLLKAATGHASEMMLLRYIQKVELQNSIALAKYL